MRHTLAVRTVPNLEGQLRARDRRQRANAIAAMDEYQERFDNAVAAEMNFDTGYMLSKYRSERTYEGLGHRGGFHADDFVGQVNDLAEPPFVIDDFYPPMVHDGTSTQAGNPFLTNALHANRDWLRRRLKRALES